MSWLDDLFQTKRGPTPVQRPQNVTPVSFPDGERPSWAGGTALFRTLGEKDLSTLKGRDAPPCIPAFEGGGMPLERRVPSWLTRQGEEVTIGDLVALSVLNFPDATGRIVGAAGDGRVECVLGDHDDPHGTRPRLTVEEDNLVMLLRKASSETYDAKRF